MPIISEDLIGLLHDEYTHAQKLLIILLFIGTPTKINVIKDYARKTGYREILKWNVSSKLSSIKHGRAIRTKEGWEITERGRKHLKDIGVPLDTSAPVEKARELRDLLRSISDDDTRSFLEEAIICTEHELHRAAIVMTWSAAIYVLHNEVVKKHLNTFNTISQEKNNKWRPVITVDDLGLMRESDFLDRLENISMIGKDVKVQLKDCLALRNSCGHPNSLKVEKLKVASHIETLMQNVFLKFL